MAWDALGAAVDPLKVDQQREGVAGGEQEFAYTDWRGNPFYLIGPTLQIEHLRVRKLRLRAPLNRTGIYYGPFNVPLPGNEAIISAYAHPFHLALGTARPTATDTPICRPLFAIRGPRSLEFCLASQALAVLTGIAGNTGINPVFELATQEDMVGDFHADIHADQYGRPLNDPRNVSIIASVVDLGLDGAGPSHIYKITFANGHSKKISSAIAPVVGAEYPAGWTSSAFDYTFGRVQFLQNRMYPFRNLFPVPSRSGDLLTRQPAINDDLVIVAVRTKYDLPSNPTSLVKVVTFANGASKQYPAATATVVGRRVGEATGTGAYYTALDPTQWVEFEVIVVTGEDKGDGTLAGQAIDPWPLPQ